MTKLRDFPECNDLLKDVVQFSVEGAQDYLQMGGSHIWQIPELWMQSEIARKLFALRLHVWLEAAMKDVREWIPTLPFLPVENERRTGFLDIALFEPHDPVSESDLRGIVEVKAIVTVGSDFNDDASRIRFIGKELQPLCGIVVGIYINDTERLVQRMIKDLCITRGDIVVQQATRPCPVTNTVYGAVGAIVQR